MSDIGHLLERMLTDRCGSCDAYEFWDVLYACYDIRDRAGQEVVTSHKSMHTIMRKAGLLRSIGGLEYVNCGDLGKFYSEMDAADAAETLRLRTGGGKL